MKLEHGFNYEAARLPQDTQVIAATNFDTVVGTYKPVKKKSDAYQSEAALEKEFIEILVSQGYEYLPIKCEEDLIENLRLQLERLNDYKFSDTEWAVFFKNNIASNKDVGIVEKTRRIQEDNVQNLIKDDGSTKNITLIDKVNIQNNSLQVINQYAVSRSSGANHDNRYDVTILVNGLPMVHIELKRRGIPIREAFNQIERYSRDSFWAGSSLFEYVQIFVISNGTNTKYYSNTTRWSYVDDKNKSRNKKNRKSNSFEFTSFWADANNTNIPDLIDFTHTFFARHTILAILVKYCVFTTENELKVMRPYQITAVERILNRIVYADNSKLYGKREGGGYIWHTTGSGKTLTSFKTAKLATVLPFIDKVIFVVDRKDLDYQTMKEYDKFEKDCANSNSSTAILKKQLEDDNARIIITTIQKLSTFIKKNKSHEVYKKRIVFIFDECHRSQFGDMHRNIVKHFKAYNMFGFTGTPIFAENAGNSKNFNFTTEQTFGNQLHSYTIVNAIADNNVLPFKVDYVKTIVAKDNISDEMVEDIEREATFLKYDRISVVTQYILEHFDQKTYRNNCERFNSIFCVASIEAAKKYYYEFKKQMDENPAKKIKVATIFSFAANADEEENVEDTSGLDMSAREFLDGAIADYNEMFNTNYSTDGASFQGYYKDVSDKMKKREIDMLIVVNMFLTGFDAKTLNTLFVDKNLKMHGLIQAFSRTNRILNKVKTFGNIVCFRNLSKQVDDALSIFGDKDAGGIVLLRSFSDYYNGYNTDNDQHVDGYSELVDMLMSEYPLSQPEIIGEEAQKSFVKLMGTILRFRNMLSSFDEFAGNEIFTERDWQDYLSRYQDIADEWKKTSADAKDISEDVVFETELIRQIDINIDYILMLVEKYHEKNCQDKEAYISIMKAIDSSPDLRSKKELIEAFLENINSVSDVMSAWTDHVQKEKVAEIEDLIDEFSLNKDATEKFIKNCFRDGEVKTYGTEINDMLPQMSMFGDAGKDRQAMKFALIERMREFFTKFYGI